MPSEVDSLGDGTGAKTVDSLTPRRTSRRAALTAQTVGGASARHSATVAELRVSVLGSSFAIAELCIGNNQEVINGK